MLKFIQNFVTMATRVGLAKIWMTPLIGRPAKSPVWYKNLGPIWNTSWDMKP